MTAFLASIETHQWVRLIVSVPWVYPTISALHILGISVLFGSILTVDLRLLRLLGPTLDASLHLLVRIALCGFAIAATTGLLLASVRISNYAANPAFLTKIAILCIAGLNALVLRVSAGNDLASLAGNWRAIRAASLSVSLWVGAVFAGRWIAFV